jgi:hypothetical protein
MTGATGDLTPDGPDEAFDPGERREISDAAHHADVTVAQSHRTPADPPEDAETPSDRGPRIGGDELADHEEHF